MKNFLSSSVGLKKLVFLFSDYVNQKGCVFLLRFHFVIFIYCHMFPPQLIFLSFPSECFRCAAFGRCPLHVFLFNELDHRPQSCVLKSCLSDLVIFFFKVVACKQNMMLVLNLRDDMQHRGSFWLGVKWGFHCLHLPLCWLLSRNNQNIEAVRRPFFVDFLCSSCRC